MRPPDLWAIAIKGVITRTTAALFAILIRTFPNEASILSLIPLCRFGASLTIEKTLKIHIFGCACSPLPIRLNRTHGSVRLINRSVAVYGGVEHFARCSVQQRQRHTKTRACVR